MRVFAACLAPVVLAVAPAASAACRGANMLDELARTDPEAHAAVLASAEADAGSAGASAGALGTVAGWAFRRKGRARIGFVRFHASPSRSLAANGWLVA